jgi:hypothetical protein
MTSRWLLAGALALAGCTSPRQLILAIDSTASVPCDIDRIRIVATAAGTTMFDQVLEGTRLPVHIALLDDTPNGSFQLEISGFKGNAEVMQVSGPLQFTGNRVTKKVLLDSRCTRNAPACTLDAAIAAAEAPVESRAECAANVTRYTASSAVDSPIDACTVVGAQRALTDGSTAPVRLTGLENKLASSDFQFYGRPVRQIWVSKDGYISFTANSPDPDNTFSPGPFDGDINQTGLAPPPQSVMAFWETFVPRPSGVCYELAGEPPSQQLRVTWQRACLVAPCGSDNLNFTILLEEAAHRVVLTYGQMTSDDADRALGLKATVGLVNDATGCPVDECTLETGLCKDGHTACGYSQVFSNTVQSSGLKNMQFLPVVDPF